MCRSEGNNILGKLVDIVGVNLGWIFLFKDVKEHIKNKNMKIIMKRVILSSGQSYARQEVLQAIRWNNLSFSEILKNNSQVLLRAMFIMMNLFLL